MTKWIIAIAAMMLAIGGYTVVAMILAAAAVFEGLWP